MLNLGARFSYYGGELDGFGWIWYLLKVLKSIVEASA
jgi:hypothetical protein